jgi:DNA recombination protein RmuC
MDISLGSQTEVFWLVTSLIAAGGVASLFTYLLVGRAWSESVRQCEVENAALNERISGNDREIYEGKEQIERLKTENDAMRNEQRRLESESIELRTQLAEERKQSLERQEYQEKLTQTFRALSGEALQQNNQSFLELAQQSFGKLQEGAKGELELRKQAIDEMLKPLREVLTKMEPAQTALTERIQSLQLSEQQLRGETANLVRALRAPVVRGRWGEIQLRRAVELAGMDRHCDYAEQFTIDTEDGRIRPDLVVHLPNGRNMVIDSKTPLEAFLEAVETDDEETRGRRMNDHARQVRDHVRKLSTKGYHVEIDSVEFTVLFLPGESIFSAALQQDRELIEFASEQGVILATPTTLIALLKAVNCGWQQLQIAENAKSISDLGRELYSRVVTFVDHMLDLKQGLDRAVGSYNSAVGSLEARLLPAARRFRDLDRGLTAQIEILPELDRIPRELSPSVLTEAEGTGEASPEDGIPPVPAESV